MTVGTVTVDVGTESYLLPKLTRKECIDVATNAFAAGRRKLMEDLREAGADAATTEKRLSEWRALEGSHELLLRHVKSLHGSTEIINASTAKMNGSRPDEAQLFELPLSELLVLAARLVGFDVKEKKEDDEDTDGYDYSKDRPTTRVG